MYVWHSECGEWSGKNIMIEMNNDFSSVYWLMCAQFILSKYRVWVEEEKLQCDSFDSTQIMAMTLNISRFIFFWLPFESLYQGLRQGQTIRPQSLRTNGAQCWIERKNT